jgi:hypothetical protein
MRQIGILSLALSTALLPLGCGATPTSSGTPDAATAKRDEYAREMNKRLDEFDAKCKELEDHIAKAEGQAKKDLQQKLVAAKIKRGVAAEKLHELKEASADRWEKVKEGAGNAFNDLKKEFE